MKGDGYWYPARVMDPTIPLVMPSNSIARLLM